MLNHPPSDSHAHKHTHRLILRQIQQQPTPSYTQTNTLYPLPSSVCTVSLMRSWVSNQPLVRVCGGACSLSRSTVASRGDRWAERERAPGQVVIPRMWGRLRGVLPEAEWPLNAPRPHPRRASRGGLLSLKTQPPSFSSSSSSHSLCWVGASQGDHRLQTHLQECTGMNM